MRGDNIIKNKECIAIVLNWNDPDLTLQCIESLYLQKGIKPDVFLVNNDSDTTFTDIVKKKFPGIEIHQNINNLGVAKGRNIGIRYALLKNYQYILLFDNDAYAKQNMIKQLVIAAKNNPSVGIFGPKIMILEKPSFIWRAGCFSWKWAYLFSCADLLYRFFRLFKKYPPYYIDKKNGFGQLNDGRFDREKNISFQIGCAQLIRNEVFKNVGLLDDEFSPYGSEDIDFCARVSNVGWKIRYIPSAQCWHRESSSYSDTYNRTYYNARNLLLLARKNLSPLFFIFIFLPDFIFLTIPLMLFKCILKNDPIKRNAFFNSLLWNLEDIKNRGVFIKKTFNL